MQDIPGRVSVSEEVVRSHLSDHMELKSLFAPIGYKCVYSGIDWESLSVSGRGSSLRLVPGS